MAAKLACMVVVCMVVAAPSAEAAIFCGPLVAKLSPCLRYMRGETKGHPPAACCGVIKSIKSAATSTADRQAACKCWTVLLETYPLLDRGLTNGLPGKCGVNMGYPVDIGYPTIDCNKVH
ncbi:PREDICTED: non-specific lipid-transfer protein-like [Ipomoea nil]|uniref:non-specific lipid-transfer protein-like n=1 Tax=Ipomoea nil TaxID=35883 RepID=UPI000900CCDC|nr:PREDICTED: non-specific lipid-transfer protein-like [Ipomoea nil]